MKKRYGVLVVAVLALAGAAVALADQPPAGTFVAVLSAEEEVPLCNPATNASRGLAIFQVTDEATGGRVRDRHEQRAGGHRRGAHSLRS